MKKISILFAFILFPSLCCAYCDTGMTTLCRYPTEKACEDYCYSSCDTGSGDFSLLICINNCQEFDIKYENCFEEPGACPAQTTLGDDTETLQALYDLRDTVLMQSAPGRSLIAMYYRLAPAINRALKSSPAMRTWAAEVLRIGTKLAQ